MRPSLWPCTPPALSREDLAPSLILDGIWQSPCPMNQVLGTSAMSLPCAIVWGEVMRQRNVVVNAPAKLSSCSLLTQLSEEVAQNLIQDQQFV